MKLYLQIIALSFLPGTILCHPPIFHSKFRGSHADSIPQKYILEFEPGAPASALLNSLPGVTTRHIYAHTLFEGASIEITDIENEENILQSILKHPDIAFISPNRRIKSNSVTISNQWDLSPESIEKMLPHEIHQVDKARKELGLTGKGIFVGIIDTGVDYTLPALGGGFGPGYKIAAGYDFIGEGNTTTATPKTNDSDPMIKNCGTWMSAHGTHIAGIIAGEDPENKFEGVAPKATLGMWRALDCDGGADLEILMLAAISAFDAGINILSYSIGYNFPWTDLETPDYKVFKRMIDHGVFVSIAASNNGESGAFTVDGLALSSFSVAAAVNKYKPVNLFLEATGVPEPLNIISMPYSKAGNEETTFNDGQLYIPSSGNNGTIAISSCDVESLKTDDLEGKIVLIYATCPSSTALLQVQARGASAAIVYSKSDVELIGYLDNKIYVPFAVITHAHAELLVNAYIKNKGEVQVKFVKPKEELDVIPFAKTISLFSSVGPTFDLGFSPNIAAVGESVYSTFPPEFGGYSIMSGTSMAAPYIAGTLALYLEYHGVNKTKPEIVLAKYKNYAYVTSLRDEDRGIIESPLRQGAGLVQIYDTITQSVYVMPPEISFKDSTFDDVKTQQLTITNGGNDTVTYKIYNNVSTAVGPYNTSQPGNYNLAAPSENVKEKAEIEFSTNEIQLGPGESQSLLVKVLPPSTNPLSHIMYGGYIQFSPLSEGHKTIHVPYFGMVGNQREIPILNQDSIVFVYNGPTQNYSYTGQVKEPLRVTHQLATNSSTSAYFINIGYTLYALSKFIKQELVNYESQEVLGVIGYEAYVGTMTQAHFASFNGCYYTPIGQNWGEDVLNFHCNNYVHNGTYVIRISALKLYGNESDSSNYESWTSIPFTIETF